MHSTFPRNTKVFIIMRNGEKYVDNYIEKKNRFIFFRELGRVNVTDLRSISYFKNQTAEFQEENELVAASNQEKIEIS